MYRLLNEKPETFLATSLIKRRRLEDDMEVFRTNFEEEQNLQTNRILAENNSVISAALSSTVGYLRKIPESKKENVERTADKQWWTNGFEKWDNDAFKHRIRVSWETFTLLLDQVRPFIEKEPTNMIPFPIEAHRQLGLTLYRLAHI